MPEAGEQDQSVMISIPRAELVEADDTDGVAEEVANIFRGGATDAAQVIVDIAAGKIVDSFARGLDKLRMDAARYVVERAVGKLREEKGAQEPAWRGFLAKIAEE